MPDERDERRSGAGGPVIITLMVVLLLPPLYVLSCGPAVALMTRGYMSEQVFETIYFPLGFTHDVSPWLGRLLESYAELWAA